MRDRYRITIAGHRDSWHFDLTPKRRQLLLGSGIGLAVLLLVCGLLITGLSFRVSGLNSVVAELEANRQAALAEIDELQAEQMQLEHVVAQKKQQLERLTSDVIEIEQLVGLSSNPAAGIRQRVDLAAQTAVQKTILLDSVPSGYPLLDTYVTSRYGNREHPVLNRDAFHKGVDLKAPRGTPVYASASGVVEWAGQHKASGLGRMVQLVHNFGFGSTYGHLEKVVVETGQYVESGELLGFSGSTGLTDGPHLHYEVTYLGRRLNPKPFLEWNLENYGAIFASEDRVQWESLTEMISRKVPGSSETPSLRQVQVSSAISP